MILFDLTRPWALIFLLILVPVIQWYRTSRSDMPAIRRMAVLVIRIIIILLLVFALAGFRLKIPKNEMSVLFVVDSSLSIPPESRDWAAKYIKEQIKKLPRGDNAGILLFGRDAYLERGLSPDPKVGRFAAITSPEYTDIAGALQLAAAVFPESSIKRVILISDGNENLGDARRQALAAAARGVEIRCLPYPHVKFPEVMITELDSPSHVSRGEPFALKVEIDSTQEKKGALKIFRNNQLIAREPVEILEGKNIFTVTQNIEPPGNYRYRASVEVENDRFPHNNLSETLTVVEGHPRVLYVYSDPRQKALLPEMLKGRKFDLTTGDLRSLPFDLAELSGYQSVVFDNVSALNLSIRQLKMIENYVKDLGGGFVMIGGDRSFGAGGYYKTPVAEILPVDLDIRKKKNLPSIAMVLCIDKSSSMSEHTGGVEKLRLAREAAIATVDLLNPKDKLGVVGFDFASKWVSILQFVDDKKRIKDEIASIRAGGGTSIYPALDSAYQALKKSQAMTKHVILLTDGRSAPAEFEKIAKEMSQDKITISTIGVGKDTDVPFLEKLAFWGQGRFYYTDEAGALPRIFVREAVLAGRSALIEEPFYPVEVESADFLKGIDLKKLPLLLGYVVTTHRERASTLLNTHQKDPLLAWWRTGLGKSVAFTSDDGLRWGKRWPGWDNYGNFWSQLIRWTLPEVKSDRFTIKTDLKAGTGHIVVDALDEEGNPLNFLPINARLVSPSGEIFTVPLEQSASGRYQGKFSAGEMGVYFVNVVEEVNGKPRTGKIQAFAIPYSPEFRKFDTDTSLLSGLASLTGGKIISPEDDIYDRGNRVVYYPRAAWMNLLLIALLLFPLDVALRRVYLPEGFYEKVTGIFSGKKKAVSSAGEIPVTMGALKKKKDELKESLHGPEDTKEKPKEKSGDVEKLKAKAGERQKISSVVIPTGIDKARPPQEPSKAQVKPEEKPGEKLAGTLGRLKKVKKDLREKKE